MRRGIRLRTLVWHYTWINILRENVYLDWRVSFSGADALVSEVGFGGQKRTG